MKKLNSFLTIYLIPLVVFGQQFDNKAIQVKINRNIETLFILYTLVDIGMPPANGSLCKLAEQEFKEFKNHRAVQLLDTLIPRTSITGPVNLVLHFSELPEIKQIYELDTSNIVISLIGGTNERKRIINEFIKAFSDFYTQAGVEAFLSKHQSYYQQAIDDVNKNLPPSNFINAMEKYYGKENQAYILNPSPVFYPNFGQGPRIATKDGQIIFNVFGPLNESTGNNKDFSFDFDNHEEIRYKSMHEFGHSFINPITEQTDNFEIINKYSYLFKPIEHFMSEQGYRDWRTCLTEHLVRLGEIRIAASMNDTLTAMNLRKMYIGSRKFIYLPFLEKKILEYENNRRKYITFEDFFPELMKVFSEVDTTKIKI